MAEEAVPGQAPTVDDRQILDDLTLLQQVDSQRLEGVIHEAGTVALERPDDTLGYVQTDYRGASDLMIGGNVQTGAVLGETVAIAADLPAVATLLEGDALRSAGIRGGGPIGPEGSGVDSADPADRAAADDAAAQLLWNPRTTTRYEVPAVSGAEGEATASQPQSAAAPGAAADPATAVVADANPVAATAAVLTAQAAATAPSLATRPATGDEDTAIALDVTAAVTGTAGGQLLTITLSGIPDGSVLSNAGGVLVVVNGTITLTAEQLAGLTITPPPNAGDDFTLTVVATSSGTGGALSSTTTLPVTVNPVSDTPTLAVQPATGNEDTGIPLAITAALTDTDGSEVLSVTIAGVPQGAVLSYAGGVLTVVNGTVTLTPAQLAGLTITPPSNSDADFTLQVTATSRDGSAAPATTTAPLLVTVNPVSDLPTLAVQAASGDEDTGIPLSITPALTDTDGSETLSITISGIPSGATLHNAAGDTLTISNGSITLTPAQLAGLAITPPANSDADFTLQVTATSRDGSAAPASVTSPLAVTVNPVSDTPTLAVQAASGDEDTGIPLSISPALTDTDGSETLGITIAGIPDGARLTNAAGDTLTISNGSITLAPAQLAGLRITPPLNSDVDFTLTVTATARDGSAVPASVTSTLAVTVNPVSDLPTLGVQDAHGAQDTGIPLSISSALTDTDGSETLSITISGIPDGAKLTNGAGDTLTISNGAIILAPNQIAGLTITPPLHSDVDFTLQVTATAKDGAAVPASVSAPLRVVVDPVTDAPTLSVQPASGAEDSAIALDIRAALTDTDGSETLGITISGVPHGASLSAGTSVTEADGTTTWTLTPDQLANLTITPPADSDVDFTVQVTATSRDGSAAPVSITTPLSVTVTPVSDAPALAVSAASGAEDSAIALDIRPALTDTDGSEYLSAIRIEGLPAGATLNHGTHNADGSWTLTGNPDDPSVLRAQLDDLKLTPPANDARDFQLTVIASSQETSRDGAAAVPAATTTRTIDVRVDAVADTPTLDVSAASGSEDGWIPLDVRSATLDTDGSETLAVLVTGLPDGAVLNHGTQNANGSWTVAAGDLGSLAIKPPANSDRDFTIHLQAQTTETGGDGAIAQQHALSDIKDIRVTVAGVADTPALTQSAAAAGNEDSRIALNLDMAVKGSNETLGLVLTGVPEGATFYSSASGDPVHSAIGHYDATTKSWSFSSDEIATLKQDGNGLYIQPPEDWSDWNTANHNAGASITATLTASQTDPDSHVTTTADKTLTFTLHVDAVADQPKVTASTDGGLEDTAIRLAIHPSVSDRDGSEEIVRITISDVPEGATLSHGQNQGHGVWTLEPGDLADLTIKPPPNSDTDFTLTITTTTQEKGSAVAVAEAVSDPVKLLVTVAGVADTPALTQSAAAAGNEDGRIALNLDMAVKGSNETLGLVLTGVPEGATFYSSASGDPVHSAIGHYDATTKSWSFSSDEIATLKQAGNGLYIQPPEDWSDWNTADHNAGASITATLTASQTDPDSHVTTTADKTLTFTLHVDAVADQPKVTASTDGGLEDTAIRLAIHPSVSDRDGSEEIVRITISDVPEGATLSHGQNQGHGVWTLEPGDLADLTIKPPPNSDTDFTLTITTTTQEKGSAVAVAEAVSDPVKLLVTVAGVADTPALTQSAAAAGNEDSRIALNLDMAVKGSNETLGLVLTGVPEGSTFYSSASGDPVHSAIGHYDATTKSWSFSSDEIATLKQAGNGLYIQPPEDWSDWNTADHNAGASITATLTASQTDPDSHVTTTADKTLTFTLHVNAVADQPTVSVLHDRLTITQNDDSGADANWLALDITPHLKDSDGSEVASLTITGVPTDAKLNHGSRNDNGSWTVPDGQWGDLKLLPGAHNAHDFTLTIVANATESGSQVAAGQGTAVSDPVRIAVTVTGIAETPLLVPGAARGNEDTLIDLKLSLSVSDPNERLTKLELTGVPSDSHFFAGSNGHPIGHDNGDGRWSFSAEEVATIRSGGLYLQPPKDWSDYDTAGHDTGMRIGATLTAEATDPDSKVVSTSHTEQTLSVRVDAVADQPKAMVAQDASGHEYDGKTPNWIALSITAPELRDQDGSETLAVTVTGLPAAALLNHGSRNDDGSWTVAAGDLGDLKVQPGAHDARDFTLTFTATATEQGSHVAVATASTSTTLKVTVEGVADTPMLRQTLPAGGDEDTRINLNLTEALGFSASSATTPETLTLTITGVPAGTKFFSAATGDTPVGTETSPGTWTFNDGEIAVVRNGSLYMLPPTDWSDYDTAGHATGMQLQAKLTASETDPDSGIVTHAPSSALDFTVTVNSVADAPSLTFAATAANGTTTVKGAEFDGKTENWIALKTFAAPTDKDGSEYVSSVTITGLPAGARLNAGIQNNDGSWTIAGDPDNPAVLREALANLKVLPGAHDARDFTLTFVATATELGSHVSKSTATTTQAVRVEVEGVADTPVLHQTLPAGGDEDTRINLNLTEALGFTLSSTTTAETLTLTITGVPDKSQFFDAEGNSIGTQSAGTWTFSDAEIAKLNQAGNGLYLKPPPDWSDWSSADHTAGLPLHVTLTATEVDPDSGKATTASTATDITVHVDAVADTPKLGVSNATGSQNDLSGAAGRWIDLKITPTVADADGSEYIASITISKVPAGATLNHGVDLGITDKATGTHSWKIDSADIAGLKLLPPAHDAKDFSITVQATASERGEDAQVSVRDALSEVKTILVTVKATAEAPILGQTGPAKGDEDTRINVHLDTRLSDPGETFTGMTISGQPEGTVFYTTDDPSSPDYGTMVGSYDAASKSWSFSAADLTKIASAGHGLFVQPPRDWSDWNSGNHSAGLALTTKLSAQKVDPDSKAVVTATTTRILAVEVDAVADAPTVTAAAAAGKEGAPIKLSIAPHLTDADGSEVIDHLTITGIPDGATLTDGNGRILTVVDGAATLTPEQLKNLHITPPAHSDADFTLHITATAKETGDPAHIATSSATSKVYDLRVTVEAVADTPKVTVTAASGNEDSWIDLGGKIAITTPDHDGSESLSLRIEGLPTGALLNHGSRNADGSWTLYQADLADLKLLPPKDVNADLTLKVTGVATEASNGDVAVSTPVTLTVTVTGTPEAPLLSQSAHASGYEDSRIDLHLTEALTDRNEALSLTLGGIPPDAQFYVSPTDATPVGQWVANSGEAFGGHYSFTAAEVDKMKAGGLFLLPPKDWSDWSSKGAAGQDWSGWSPGQGGMAVTATLISTDTDVDTGVQTSAGTKITFDVHVKGVADAPNGLGAGNFQVHVKEDGDAASGNVTHGSLVDLGFGALSPKDGDGSEHLSVVISDLPAGCSLQFANGVSIDNLVPIAPGKWSVDQQYLSSLRLVVPENANVDTRGVLTLRADVVVTEVDGDVRIDQRSVEVTIDAVTDQARISGGGTYDEDAVMALHLSVAAGGIGETVDSISLDLGKLPSGSTFLYDGREVAIPAGGLYTVPAGFDLSKFAVKPPQNYSDYTNHGNPISIGVSVVSHDHGAASLTTTKTLTLAVSGVADAPTVSGSFSDLTMNSGLFAALPVADRLNLGDKDSSERLWMAVDGLPDGAILVDGAGHLVGLNEGHGRWLLTPAQWDTATGGGGLNLRVPVGLRDSSGTALTSATITITPLSVERDTGSVGQGSPTHFSISFAENGASHGGGSHANNGWGNGDQTAPGNSGPNNNAENSTGSTGNGNGNQNNGNHGHAGGAGTGELVPIDPTMPSLGYGQLQPNGVIGAKGAEDGTIALSIKIGGHSGQTATLVIDAASLPAGAKLSAGIYDPVHNVWTVGESEIADLSITPPANWNSEQNGSITLLGHVVLTDPATGGTSIAALPMTVLVDAVTDSPTLSGGGQGKEDHPIALNLAVAAGAAGETVESVVISDVPPGAKLIDANGAVLAADPVTGHYTMSVATAAGLKLLPPANWSDYSGSLTLHVEVTARDHLAAPVTIDKTITVGVAGVTDPVTLDTSKASGREDQWITLNDATIRHLTASLDDTDGSQAMSVVITGVPAGAVFNHGANNGLDASGTTYSWKFSAADVGDLKFLAPQDYNGTLTLSVTAYTWERGKGDPVDGGMVATTAPLTIAVAAAADAPQIFVHMARGTEDSPIALDISGMVPSRGNDMIDAWTITLPSSAYTLSAGTLAADGVTWTLTPAQLANLTVSAPHDSAASFTVTVAARSSELDPVSGQRVYSPVVTTSFAVNIDAVADKPTVSAAAASGMEDGWIELKITPAVTDADGSESIGYITIDKVPDGALLNHGVDLGITDPASNTHSWRVSAADIAGLKLLPPPDDAHDMMLSVRATSIERSNGNTATSDAVGLAVTVTAAADTPHLTQSAPAHGDEDSRIALNLSPMLGAANETLSMTLTGIPDGAVLYLSSDPDDPRTVGTFDAVSHTWRLLGSDLAKIQANGLYLKPPPNWSDWSSAGHTTGMTVVATLTSTDHDPDAPQTAPQASTSLSFTVHVDSVADAPKLTASPVTTPEDQPIALNIRASLGDTTGSEYLVGYTITGVPTGASLNHGTRNGDGSWSLKPGDVDGLKITPPLNSDADFTLHIEAVSHNWQNDGTATATADLRVTVNGVADTPALTQGTAAAGNEDTRIALNLDMAVKGSNETLGLVLTGVPEGSTFYSSASGGAIGHYDAMTKSWSFDSGEIATLKQTGNGLYIKPPEDWSDWNTANHNAGASITATLTASQTDPDSHVTTTADKTLTFTLHINAVADQPTVSVLHDRLTITQNDDSGADANWLALDITPHLKDSDGSEVASLTITGVPTDAKLNHGSRNDNGSWTMPDGQWGDLKLLPGAHNAHDFTLTIVANATESGSQVAAGQGTAVSDPVRIAVTVTGIAETPLLVPGAARGNEDTLIDLKLSLSVSDPNERLTKLELTGVPSDSHFFAGSNGHPIGHDDGNGRWSFSAEEVATIRSGGLYLQPPKNWSDYDTAGHDTGMRIGATLTAEATDPDSKVVSTSHTEQTLSLHVDGVADQPDLTLAPVHGTVGTAIALNIGAVLKDTDGSETLTVTIAPLPSGYSLNNGHHNTDGSWTLGAQDLPGLALTAPAGAAGSVALSVTAQATDGHSTAETTGSLTVTLDPANQAPVLSADHSATISAADPKVAEHASVTDPDSSELSRLTISIVSGAESGDRLTLGSLSLVEDPATHRTTVAGTDVEVSWDAAANQLTLHGTASTATYTDILQHVSMTTADGSGMRTLEVKATDAAGGASNPMRVDVQVVGDQITNAPASSARTFAVSSADPTETGDGLAASDHAMAAAMANTGADAGTAEAGAVSSGSSDDAASGAAALDRHYTESMALLGLSDHPSMSGAGDWTGAGSLGGGGVSTMDDSWIGQSSHPADPATTGDPLAADGTTHHDPAILTPVTPEVERVPA